MADKTCGGAIGAIARPLQKTQGAGHPQCPPTSL